MAAIGKADLHVQAGNFWSRPGPAVEDQALHPWFTGIYGYQWLHGNFTGESGDFTAIAGVG
jgi:hypothetical protein